MRVKLLKAKKKKKEKKIKNQLEKKEILFSND